MKIEETNNEHFLTAFASAVGPKVEGGRVVIPAKYGKGYVFGYLSTSCLTAILISNTFLQP